ncbi:hypothetical protein B566_EDAN012532 [Ephemera danica]|nr:hypothetical protein B566_EDAN012532 [Ephemera danica]
MDNTLLLGVLALLASLDIYHATQHYATREGKFLVNVGGVGRSEVGLDDSGGCGVVGQSRGGIVSHGGSSVGGEGGGVGVGGHHRAGITGNGGGIGEGSGNTGSNHGGGDLSDNSGSLLAHDSVESVDGVSGVLDNATSSVSLHERVRSLDNISVAALLLLLVVSGQSISDGVGVSVLRVGVVVSVDNGSAGQDGGSSVTQRSDDSSAGNSHEGGQNDELRLMLECLALAAYIVSSPYSDITALASHKLARSSHFIVLEREVQKQPRPSPPLDPQWKRDQEGGNFLVNVGGVGGGEVGLDDSGGSVVSHSGGCVVSHSGGSMVSHSGGSIGEGSSDLSDHGGGDLGNDSGSLLVHDSVESVDGVSGVLDNATGSVSLHEGVRSLDDISVAGLLLVLVVSGQGISDGVGVSVLRVGVVVSVDSDGSLGDHGGSSVGSHSGGSSVAQRSDDSSAGNSHEGGENDELWTKIIKTLFLLQSSY